MGFKDGPEGQTAAAAEETAVNNTSAEALAGAKEIVVDATKVMTGSIKIDDIPAFVDQVFTGVAEVTEEKMVALEALSTLEIKGAEDKDGFEKLHAGRMVVKNSRLAIQKLEEQGKSWAERLKKAFKTKVDTLVPRLTKVEALLETRETHFLAEKARVKREAEMKLIGRQAALRALEVDPDDVKNLVKLTDEEFEVIRAGAQKGFDDAQEALRLKKQKELEEQQERDRETERVRQENEQLKLRIAALEKKEAPEPEPEELPPGPARVEAAMLSAQSQRPAFASGPSQTSSHDRRMEALTEESRGDDENSTTRHEAEEMELQDLRNKIDEAFDYGGSRAGVMELIVALLNDWVAAGFVVEEEPLEDPGF